MKKSKFSESQIIKILSQQSPGQSVSPQLTLTSKILILPMALFSSIVHILRLLNGHLYYRKLILQGLVKVISNFININKIHKRIYIIFSLLLFNINCSNNKIIKNRESEKTIELLLPNTNNSIEINENEVYLSVSNIHETKHLVSWGENSTKVFTDTIQIIPSGNPTATIHKDKGIYVIQGCGTSCSFVYILSFKNPNALHYYSPLVINLEYDLLAYSDEDNSSLVIVENYNTFKKHIITLGPLEELNQINPVDSIQFDSDYELYIRWKASEEKYKEATFQLFDAGKHN